MRKRVVRRIGAIAVLTAMVCSVTACGTKTAESAGAPETTGKSSAGSTEGTGSAEAPKKMRYVAPGSDWEKEDEIIGLVNEKLQREGVNIEVELVRIPWDAWDQKVNLMLSTGEEFELLHVMQDRKSATVLRSQNAIQPLNDYLDNFPDLKETLSERWPEFTVNGEILAVPVKPNYYISRDYGRIFYRQDIFEKAGGKVPETVDEVIELAQKMQDILMEDTGEKCYTWLHTLSRPATWLHRSYEEAPFIVDNTMGIAKCNMDGTVDSFYESDIFKRDCETYQKMYELGLIDPDILTTDSEDRSNAADYGKFIFGFETIDYQSESTMTKNVGAYMGDFWLNPELGNVEYFGIYNGNAVPVSCKDPNVPLSFLNWLYGDAENYQLFMYGVEGETYKKVDDNMMETIFGADGKPLYKYDDWQMGNADYRLYDATATETLMKMYTTPVTGTNVRTPLVGFNFDPINVSNEVANLTNEIITSIYPIKFGVVDYDDNIDQAIQRLKAAGLDKVLEEYSKQYKEHYEANKDLVGVFQK